MTSWSVKQGWLLLLNLWQTYLSSWHCRPKVLLNNVKRVLRCPVYKGKTA